MAELSEKASRYGRMLADAVGAVEVVDDSDEADGFLRQAESYLEDGRRFLDEGDEVNALAAFSYGHAWLDAGMRMGFYETDAEHEELFAA
ncbi:MAG: hypothetical protein ACI9QA_000362 [Methanobacteriota archaeon]|jgi:hypothetical protein|uniref:DUF357 domain-containing protein n=1 Tax=Halorutilus salinus TaxID=2487751 RepID=A0A9Q4GGS3_9EURY|nr:DUF357 domain-containing protein [Halorutilus salinus]MCX2819007.1 DUF357 domain-containing protein [Halorutilus salinus]